MAMTTTILRLLIRALGIIQVLLGLLFWTGNAYNLVNLHISLGSLLVLCLWMLAIVGIFARISWLIILGAFAWGLFVPVFGMAQAAILPGSFHWIIQVLHLLVGIASVGFGENLTRRIQINHAVHVQS